MSVCLTVVMIVAIAYSVDTWFERRRMERIARAGRDRIAACHTLIRNHVEAGYSVSHATRVAIRDTLRHMK